MPDVVDKKRMTNSYGGIEFSEIEYVQETKYSKPMGKCRHS